MTPIFNISMFSGNEKYLRSEPLVNPTEIFQLSNFSKMAHIRAGIVIFHPTQSSVLLVRNTLSNMWGFPKGHPEPSDRDLLDTAVRETYAETGFVKDVHYRLLSTVSKFYGYTNIFWAEALTSTLVFPSCIEEHVAEVAWVPISQIPHMKCNQPVREWIECEY